MRYLLAFAGVIIAANPAAAAEKGNIWSEITGERFSHSSLNRSGTLIKMIDGYPTIDRKPRMKPGPHILVVQWIPKKGLRTSDRTLRLDMKPCKRYYVNAQFSSPGSALWQPIVDKVEDIAGCNLQPTVGAAAAGKDTQGGKETAPGKAR